MTFSAFQRLLVTTMCLALMPDRATFLSGLAGQTATLPDTPLTYGGFAATFDADGTFAIDGEGWPPMKGAWRVDGADVLLTMSEGPKDCTGPARYRFDVAGRRLEFTLVSDECTPRRMILDHSVWTPRGDPRVVPERRLVRTAAPERRPLPRAAPAAGSWPSFRGPLASGVADGQQPPRPLERQARARTSCGARRSPDWRIRVRSSGAT